MSQTTLPQLVGTDTYGQSFQDGINPVVTASPNATVAGAGSDTIFAGTGTATDPTTFVFNLGYGPAGRPVMVAGAGTVEAVEGPGPSTVFGGTGQLDVFKTPGGDITLFAGHGAGAVTQLVGFDPSDHVLTISTVQQSSYGANWAQAVLADGSRIDFFEERASQCIAAIVPVKA